MIDPLINFLIALAFATLLAGTAVMKLRSPARFRATLADYRLIPPRLVYITSLIVMGTEMGVAAGLISPTTRPMCSLVGLCIVLLYAVAIAINLVRGRREIDCGCSLESRPIGRWMVVRNLLLALALAVAALPVTPRALGIVDVATSGAGVLVLTLLYASLDLLLSLPGKPWNPPLEHS